MKQEIDLLINTTITLVENCIGQSQAHEADYFAVVFTNQQLMDEVQEAFDQKQYGNDELISKTLGQIFGHANLSMSSASAALTVFQHKQNRSVEIMNQFINCNMDLAKAHLKLAQCHLQLIQQIKV